ncbi:MAG: hypothetical protein HON04_18130, partial [Planctomicrobium sp.]|nr:hypothetical protein [Planctomicrobium sp.]
KTELSELNWFGNIGQELDYAHAISDPEEWTGPECPLVMPLGYWEQELFDSFMTLGNDKELRAVFEEIRLQVIELTKTRVPYVEDGDTWEWPNFAVAVASWTAGLAGLCLMENRDQPMDLQTQWEWFSQGRIPLGYAVTTGEQTQLFTDFYSNGPPEEGYVAYFEANPNQFLIY